MRSYSTRRPIFGFRGFMRQLGHDMSTYKVEEIFRDYKIAEIYEGTNEIMRLVIARNLLKQKK